MTYEGQQVTSSVIIDTQENAQAMMEIFNQHVSDCGEPLKDDILKKALQLKGNDYKILGNFVEELKQSEGIEL